MAELSLCRQRTVKRGEIYLVSLDPTSGHEQRGRRPVLIISPDKFNAFTQVPVIVPITKTGAFARNAGFAVPLENAGTRTTGFVRCDQPRSMDLHARHGQRLEKVPSHLIEDVLSRVSTLFE